MVFSERKGVINAGWKVLRHIHLAVGYGKVVVGHLERNNFSRIIKDHLVTKTKSLIVVSPQKWEKEVWKVSVDKSFEACCGKENRNGIAPGKSFKLRDSFFFFFFF
jgi:hypothetical protein